MKKKLLKLQYYTSKVKVESLGRIYGYIAILADAALNFEIRNKWLNFQGRNL